MLRAALSVIAGYAAMFVCVFVSFSVAYLAMGTDRAFRPGSYEVSGLWLAVSFVLSVPAALVGGWLCARLNRGGKAPWVLAGLVLVLGLLMAVPVLQASGQTPEPRSAEVGNLEAMSRARQPAWVALLNPLIGCAGVVLGARLRKPAATVSASVTATA